MFQWLSQYNYDYALAAIPIQLILLIFYCFRKNLPIRSSYSFLGVMIANLAMTAFDLISCEMNEIWTEYPLWLMYLVNQGYFLGFIIRGWTLYDYTAVECNGYRALGKWFSHLTHIPALVAILLILSTPWTATIFHFSPEKGYYNCEIYPIIYFCTYFYIAVSLLCVFLQWKHLDLRLKLSMLEYNIVLIAGILLRKQFINTLVTSYFSILAILFIYLSAQNPDLYRDKKTHLFNKDAFEKIGTEYLVTGTPFHCIVATIHNYMSAKNLYGYQQLSTCLEIFGQWLRRSFPGYYVFYFGNGDFLLFRKGRFEDNKENILRSMEEYFGHSWKSADTEISLSISAMALPSHLFPKDIAKAADFIAYMFTKAYVENRKGNVVVSEENLRRVSRLDIVETALSRALKEHRIEAYFQPIYSVREQRITGAEALARFRDAELGCIPPQEFVRVAEHTGDIMEMGRQVFERVCEFLETEQPELLGLKKINVNLSPAQCMNDQLASELSAIAEKHHVSMEMIDFEITETSLENRLLLQKQMLHLQEKGARFSLDDFGAGTSNLVRLLNLPIHEVKLDISLVTSYFEGGSPMLPDLVRMFRNADMEIVAEGVETKEMAETLAEMGCDYEQGYYFSRPVPPKDFIAYLKKNTGHA